MNNTILIPTYLAGSDESRELSDTLRKFKGETEIIFDFDGGGKFFPVKIILDFNDGSPLYVKDYNFNESNFDIFEPIKHVYNPTNETYNIIYYPTIFITYSNFTKFIYQIPIKIAKDSFHSNLGKIEIASSQFIDTLDDSIFLTLDTSKGDIINLKIK
jgi:hypothetical protein